MAADPSRGEADDQHLPRRRDPAQGALRIVLAMLWRDKFATFAVIFLLVAILCAIFGPALLGEAATRQNLRGRNAPPFSSSRAG